MLVQNCEPYLLHRACIIRRSTGVIDHPIVRDFARNPWLAKKNHDVEGILLDPRLMEKDQVAGPGLLSIATDEIDVEHLQCLSIGKL